jgi:hypothetical protein
VDDNVIEPVVELDMQELETMDAPGFLTGMVASATVTGAIIASAAAAYT